MPNASGAYAGFAAHLVVQNTALREYPDSSQEHAEPDSITRLVEILPNVPFAVHAYASHNAQVLGDVLIFRVIVNDVLRAAIWHRPLPSIDSQAQPGSSAQQAIQVRFNQEESEALMFGEVAGHDNNSSSDDAAALEACDVVLRVSHGRFNNTPEAVDLSGMLDDGVEEVEAASSAFTFIFKCRSRKIVQDIKLKSGPDKKDPDERYCYCKRIRRAYKEYRVVACDNDDCKIKWFHWDCVGLVSEPETKWLCPTCNELPRNELQMEGRTLFYGKVYNSQKCGFCNAIDTRTSTAALAGGWRGIPIVADHKLGDDV